MLRTGRPRPISLFGALIFAVALTALLVAALFPIFPNRLNVHVNDIAARTVRAPRDVTFESEFLTKQRQDDAANAVPESFVYDARRRTEQLQRYDNLIAEISRARGLTDEVRRRTALETLGDAALTPQAIDIILAMPEERWQAVITEGRRVLADALSVSLDDAGAQRARDTIDPLIAADFTASEATAAAELVRPVIVPTLASDQAATAEARAAARESVSPQIQSVAKNDVIIAAGSRVDEVDIETLEAAGLLSRDVDWRNVAAVAILAALVALVVAGYLYVLQPRAITSERHVIALGVVTVAPLVVAKLCLPLVLPDDERQFLAFVLPVAAGPLLIAGLLDTHVAAVVAAATGVLIALISTLLPDASLVASITPLDTLRLLLVYGLAPVAGVFIVHRADRLSRYLTAGIAVAVAALAALSATWLIDPDREAIDFAWMSLMSGVSGVSSGVLAAGAFVTVGALFGVTTRVQLMELSQLNAPLLRRLQDEAPGTFHHSVLVGNLAERAADLVGADALLTRVGCYYHDIGKVLRPGLYVENQLAGERPHEEMTPEESAGAIKQHVVGGLDLARRARLPERVRAFIPEHHGTRLVAYFYRKAAEDDPQVSPAAFQYPGPRPQSRETAIVMLADSTEAVIRASEDRSPQRIDQHVEEVLAERLAEGQLDDCELTMRDLRTIAESFKATMRAVYHPRVQYPEPTPMEARRRMLRFPRVSPGAPARGDGPRSPRPRRPLL